MDHEQVRVALAQCEFFQGLTPQDIERVVALCEVKRLEAGEFVFEQGDFGEDLFVIVDGQLFLDHHFNLGDRQANVTIASLGRGRVLGCWSTMLDEAHILMCSAVCAKPSLVVRLSGSQLRRLMVENKEFGFIMLQRLALLLRDRVRLAYGALEKF